MYHTDYLMKARQDDLRREIARNQLVAEARRARAARRQEAQTRQARRLPRVLVRGLPARSA